MVDRRFQELCRDALAALIGRDDEADDRADVRGAVARDAFELSLGRRVAPADDTTQAIRDEPVRPRGAQELATRRAILLLGPGLVVVDDALHAEAFGPVRVVGVRDQVEVVHDRVVLVGRDWSDRNFAHTTSLSHRPDQK